jgi:hypothetical protein
MMSESAGASCSTHVRSVICRRVICHQDDIKTAQADCWLAQQLDLIYPQLHAGLHSSLMYPWSHARCFDLPSVLGRPTATSATTTAAAAAAAATATVANPLLTRIAAAAAALWSCLQLWWL